MAENELLRLALILNFIFTTLAFREILFLKIFSKITSLGSYLNKFIIFQPLSITILLPVKIQIGIINRWPPKNIKTNIIFMFVFFLLEFGLFYVYPDIFMNIILFPRKMFSIILLLWNNLSQWYFIPLNIILTFCISILIVVTSIVLLGYLLITPIKLLLTISDFFHKYISKTIFALIIYLIFVFSWILTWIVIK